METGKIDYTCTLLSLNLTAQMSKAPCLNMRECMYERENTFMLLFL